MPNTQAIEKIKNLIFERLSYTSQDYNSIITELIELLPEISPNWNNISEADIIFIMLSLMAAHKDILNYMMDYRVLEGYMSTAKERASLARIAASFGYKIPSFRAAKANLVVLNNQAGLSPFVIKSFDRLIDSTDINWAYIGEEKQIVEADVIEVFQGLPTSVTISFANIDQQTKTHIISNQSIAIGNNANDLGCSSLVVSKSGEDDIIFEEVDNIYTYVGDSNLIYQLAVDPQGITFIKFLDTLNTQDYDGYTAEFYYLLTQGPNITSVATATAILSDSSDPSVNAQVTFGSPADGYDFVLGSAPLTAQEIREGFRRYYAGSNVLVTLEDYRNFILFRQKAVQGITKCLVIDGQSSTRPEFQGNSSFVNNPGIYVMKGIQVLDNTQGELNTLRTEINKFKVTGVIPSINGEPIDGQNVGAELQAANIVVFVNKIPDTEPEKFKALVANYINSKEIGATLTTTEILNVIRNSEFAPNFEDAGISILLSSGGVSSRTILEFTYNQYLVCNTVTGVQLGFFL